MLSKRWLINGLLFLVIGTSAVIGYRDQDRSTPKIGTAITSLNPVNVNEITIQIANNVTRLHKLDSLWMIKSPLQWPANNVAVDRILGVLLSRSEASISAAEIDLSEIGLLTPKAILSFNNTQIKFGTSNNIGERRYLMLDDRIHLVDDLHFPLVTQELSALIDRHLLPPSIALQSFKISGKHLLRVEDNSWKLRSPADISTQQLTNLVNNWQNLEAPVVKIYKPAGIPLEKIQAGLSSGFDIEFLLISIKPELVIARPDLGFQYHFSEKLYPQLFKFTNPE